MAPAQAAKPEPSTFEQKLSYEQELLVSGRFAKLPAGRLIRAGQ